MTVWASAHTTRANVAGRAGKETAQLEDKNDAVTTNQERRKLMSEVQGTGDTHLRLTYHANG